MLKTTVVVFVIGLIVGLLPTAAAQTAGGLGEGDTVTVSVVGRDDFNETVKVGSDGSIRLPLIGIVAATGLTPLQLAETVEGELTLQGFFADPVVDVRLQAVESRTVTVLGRVSNPGVLSFDRNVRVSEVIARAGGIAPGSADHLVLRSTDGQSRKLVIADIAMGGVGADPIIAPGDKLFVPEAEQYYIYGQVNAPGEYALPDGATLRKALAGGGGLTSVGSARRIKLVRGEEEMKRVGLDTPIMAGDVIVVGERLF